MRGSGSDLDAKFREVSVEESEESTGGELRWLELREKEEGEG